MTQRGKCYAAAWQKPRQYATGRKSGHVGTKTARLPTRVGWAAKAASLPTQRLAAASVARTAQNKSPARGTGQGGSCLLTQRACTIAASLEVVLSGSTLSSLSARYREGGHHEL